MNIFLLDFVGDAAYQALDLDGKQTTAKKKIKKKKKQVSDGTWKPLLRSIFCTTNYPANNAELNAFQECSAVNESSKLWVISRSSNKVAITRKWFQEHINIWRNNDTYAEHLIPQTNEFAITPAIF